MKKIVCVVCLALVAAATAEVPAVWGKARTLTGVVLRDLPAGTVQVKCAKASRAGETKISLVVTPLGGRKASYKAQKAAIPDSGVVAVSWPDGTRVEVNGDAFSGRMADGRAVEQRTLGGSLRSDAQFVLDAPDLATKLRGAFSEYLPDGLSVRQNGTRWTVADGERAGKVAYLRGTHDVDTAKLGKNPSGLKLSYAARTGLFKGSFKVWYDANGKVKSAAASVNGLLVDGVGHGLAQVKKVGDWPVRIGAASTSGQPSGPGRPVTPVQPATDYLVIDLSAGPTAASYPVTYLRDVPAGGWTDEYKTRKLVLRRIPAGTFTMGSPADELGRVFDNEDLHKVTLTKSFHLGVFEVTQRQWELVTGLRPSYFLNDDYYATRPVEQVSHYMIRGAYEGALWPHSATVDADSFLGVLRAKTGLSTLDLPTEAQWEYACRAGTTSALNNGANLANSLLDLGLAQLGRYSANNADKTYAITSTTATGTAKVGSYLPNAWGLYDMHGNVYEWCLDFGEGHLGTAAVTDPPGAVAGATRVIRGGSWTYDALTARSAFRDFELPTARVINVGFRLCLR